MRHEQFNMWSPQVVKRRKELKAQGLSAPVAAKISLAETVMRQRIAQAVGDDVARSASLAITTNGSDVKCFVVCPDAGLSASQRHALRSQVKAVRGEILPA